MPSVTSSSIITSTAQIGDKVITTADIGDSAVDTLQIAANAVTDAKIAAHTTTKITVPVANLSGAVATTQGGTGAATAAAGFDALAPTTTKGDLIVRDTSTNARLAASTSGQVLTAQGTGSLPVWAAAPQVPNWVDLETITWSADSNDKTSATFAVYDIIMVALAFTSYKKMQLRLNGVSAANYSSVTTANATLAETTGATSILLADCLAGANGCLVGTLLIAGKRGIAGNTVIPVGAQLNGTYSGGNDLALIKGSLYQAAANLTNLTILVNGVAATGKAHIYGLNL